MKEAPPTRINAPPRLSPLLVPRAPGQELKRLVTLYDQELVRFKQDSTAAEKMASAELANHWKTWTSPNWPPGRRLKRPANLDETITKE